MAVAPSVPDRVRRLRRASVVCSPPAGRPAAPCHRDGTHRLRGQPREAGALVEEYLVGPEVSVESLSYHGETVLLGVTDKMLGPHPCFFERGETFPSVLPPELTQACADVARAAPEAVGHDFGAARVEVKLTAKGPRLIEVNARMGGAQITRLVRESTGSTCHARSS